MKWLHSMRRHATRRATIAALDLAGRLGCARVLSLGVAGARFAHLLPGARQRLRDNLQAAGVDASEATIQAYFRRFGLWVGHTLGVFGAGLDRSLAAGQVELDPATLGRLDDAVARGKGVVLASPHMFCHEIGAGLIHRRHPLAALVRENRHPGWERVKDRWYEDALGVGMVLRPRKGSVAGDVGEILQTLRAGTILGITPDVLMTRTSGMSVSLFNRPVCLSPGMILLAMRSGAPVITAGFQWSPDPTLPGRERLRISFSEPLELSRSGNRKADLRAGLQRWCDQFEATLRQSPADWLFWLDKGWTKVFRQPTRVREA